VAGFCALVEDLVDRHGEHLATLQVCEEPNVTGAPALDGAYPRVAEALIAGVKIAKQAAERSGRDIKVGRNSTPLLGPAAAALNITGYIHHTLRDARSDGSGLFCRFGLMTDDYTPKPAFPVYRDLISRFSPERR
jgi:hypothetical protein